MTMTLPCPQCRRQLSIAPQNAGRLIRCPFCSNNFQAQATAAPGAAPRPAPSPPAPAPQAPAAPATPPAAGGFDWMQTTSEPAPTPATGPQPAAPPGQAPTPSTLHPSWLCVVYGLRLVLLGTFLGAALQLAYLAADIFLDQSMWNREQFRPFLLPSMLFGILLLWIGQWMCGAAAPLVNARPFYLTSISLTVLAAALAGAATAGYGVNWLMQQQFARYARILQDAIRQGDVPPGVALIEIAPALLLVALSQLIFLFVLQGFAHFHVNRSLERNIFRFGLIVPFMPLIIAVTEVYLLTTMKEPENAADMNWTVGIINLAFGVLVSIWFLLLAWSTRRTVAAVVRPELARLTP